MTDDVVTALAPAEPNLPDTGQYSRVTPEESAKFFRLRREGLTFLQIAQLTARSVETVHRHLTLYDTDTTEDAHKVLAADALPAALELSELMRSGTSRDKVRLEAVKANLTANKLLGHESASTNVAVQVVLGVPANVTLEGNT